MISDANLALLSWLDLAGLVPRSFSSSDRFVTDEGLEVTLEEANPPHVVWLPTIESLSKVLEQRSGAQLRRVVKERMIILYSDYRGSRIEGAGLTELQALMFFIERLRDAHFEGSPSSG